MKARRIRMVLWALPAAVLVTSYAGVCVPAGTWWPWHHVVHEDGLHTLAGTIFFFEHATRELIPDAILALGLAGAMRYFFPPYGHSNQIHARNWRRRLGWITIATLATIVGGTLWTRGLQALVDNLSQLHTREGAPLVWGAHWRYHLVERFAEVLLAFCASGVVWIWCGKPAPHIATGRGRFYIGTFALFVGVTLLFRLTSEPFREPVFIGHQLRELLTHTLVTLPLALGVCLSLASTFARTGSLRSSESGWPIVLAGALSVLAGGFLLAASVATGARSYGQTTSLAGLLFPHFFEHSLGYVLVPALSGLLYLQPGPMWPHAPQDGAGIGASRTANT